MPTSIQPLDLLLAVTRSPSGLSLDLQWGAAIWLTIVGGCLGSLMNVVVYRWPAGLSIVRPASRCPQCLHPIRLYDNVPVLGWLMLRGRCRDCKTSIPFRYPLVEAIVAGIFLAFLLIEVFSGGANLPAADPSYHEWHSERATRILWWTYAVHVSLLSLLFCASLIEFDGQRVPWKLLSLILFVGVLPTLIFPDLQPILVATTTKSELTRLDGLASVVQGCLIGAGLGSLTGALLPSSLLRHDNRSAIAALYAASGAVLGWQSVAFIASITAVFTLLSASERTLRGGMKVVGPLGCFNIALALFLVYWRVLDNFSPQLATRAGLPTLLATCAVTLGLSALTGWLCRETADAAQATVAEGE